MVTLQFYTRPDCALCHSALAVVRRAQQHVAFDLDIVNIDADAALRARYGSVIPVVTFNNVELARSFVDEKKLREAVQKITVQG